MEFFFIWIICAIVCAVIASSKNRSGAGWFFLGLLLGIFGVIIIACLSKVEPTIIGGAGPAVAYRKCPHCAETILAEAKVCKHCQRDVNAVESLK